MAKVFTKNQTVVLFQNYDSKGHWVWQRAIVRSCGAKQMTLEALDGEMLGRNFSPCNERNVIRGNQIHTTITVADMSDAEIEAMGLALATEHQEFEAKVWNASLERDHSEGYKQAIRNKLAELNAPRLTTAAQAKAEFLAAWNAGKRNF